MPCGVPDGHKIASDGTGQYLLIWDLAADKVYPLPGYSGRFGEPYWKADFRQVASSDGDGIHFWDIVTTRNILTIPHTRLNDWRSTDSKILISGVNDEAYVWDLTTNRAWLRLDHGASVLSAKWNFNARLIATGGLDGVVKIWDGQSGELLTTITQHSDLIAALAWHPTQNLLVAASFDKSLSIWKFDVN